jgi:hypothetical protein
MLLSYFSSASVIIAAVIAAIRYNKILVAYRPFVFVLWLGVVAELISHWLVLKKIPTAINTNIYVLIESLLILWLFRNWKQRKKDDYKFIALGVFFIVVWVFETLLFKSISEISGYFRMVYSFVFVFLSIDTLNRIVINERKKLLFNGRFIIVSGFLLYFSFKTLIEIFWSSYFHFSDQFYVSLYAIIEVVNLITNLIYAYAVIWIPSKQKFTLPY